jgi:cytochrome oxidase Cu insertion factor (SCO1/SenC/PrrC family)
MKMKHLLVLVLGLGLFNACGGSQNPENNLQISTKAPAFSVPDQNGKTVTLLSLHKDGPVILTFLRSFY